MHSLKIQRSKNGSGRLLRWMAIGICCFGLSGCTGNTVDSLAASELDMYRFSESPYPDLARYKDVQKRPGQKPELALAVAISGGGLRAANFAAGALAELAEMEVSGSNVLAEVDYLSTVSGGGLAAGTYVHWLSTSHREISFPCSLAEQFCDDKERRYKKAGHYGRALRHPYEGAIRQGAFVGFLDTPFGRSINRGDWLEEALDRGFFAGADGSTMTLGDIFIRSSSLRQPTLPIWVANATVYRNGMIFPFMPHVFEDLGICEYVHRRQTISRGRDEDGCARTTSEPEFAYRVPLSVGVKASASFPQLISTTHLRSDKCDRCYLHLTDGGLADNLGVFTALTLLAQESAEIRNRATRRVLIVIDAFPDNAHPFSEKHFSPSVFDQAEPTSIGWARTL